MAKWCVTREFLPVPELADLDKPVVKREAVLAWRHCPTREVPHLPLRPSTLQSVGKDAARAENSCALRVRRQRKIAPLRAMASLPPEERSRNLPLKIEIDSNI